MWHGEFYLNKAIELLDKENRKDFENFVNTKTSFHPHNMFICKSKKIMKNYYETVFPWLKRCEDEFGFENLKGYDTQRLYAYLAERYLSFWFNKYTRTKTWPWTLIDINKN